MYLCVCTLNSQGDKIHLGCCPVCGESIHWEGVGLRWTRGVDWCSCHHLHLPSLSPHFNPGLVRGLLDLNLTPRVILWIFLRPQNQISRKHRASVSGDWTTFLTYVTTLNKTFWMEWRVWMRRQNAGPEKKQQEWKGVCSVTLNVCYSCRWCILLQHSRMSCWRSCWFAPWRCQARKKESSSTLILIGRDLLMDRCGILSDRRENYRRYEGKGGVMRRTPLTNFNSTDKQVY